MTLSAYFTLAILVVTFVLLTKTKLPVPVIFMGALTLAISFRLAPTQDLLKGFSNQGMLTVAVLFVVAAGMYATGAITMVMGKLVGLPKTLLGAKIKILPPIAVGSAFLNNTPLVAMMIPVIADLSKATGLSRKQLYIPLSFASILGGVCTTIGTSTNLVIAGLVADTLSHGGANLPQMRDIRMFDPAMVALPAAVIGIGIMLFLGKFLLPKDDAQTAVQTKNRRYAAEFEVRLKSRIVGKTLEAAGLCNAPGLDLVSISRDGGTLPECREDTLLKAGDLLAFSIEVEALVELWQRNSLVPHLTLHPMETKRHHHHLVKVVVSRKSEAVGRAIQDLPKTEIANRFKIVAVSRDGLPVEGPLDRVVIEPGDNAVLEVNDSFFFESQLDKDFALTMPLKGYHLDRTDRAVEASLITTAMVLVVALGWMSMLNAGLLAAGAMLATGCLSFRTAAHSIDWGTLVVIASAIGLESAVTHSGLADNIAELLNRFGADNPHMALLMIFIGCTLMTNVITNNAAAAFMYPIALATAGQMGVNFMPFVVTLMVAASCAFITPTGYQTNLMIWQPGGYKFMDFVKIGSVMTVIIAAVTLVLAPLVFPF